MCGIPVGDIADRGKRETVVEHVADGFQILYIPAGQIQASQTAAVGKHVIHADYGRRVPAA